MVGKHDLNDRIKLIQITDTELIGNDAGQLPANALPMNHSSDSSASQD